MRTTADVTELLTPVEMQVFRCLGQGLTTDEIRRVLDKSMKTIGSHYSAMKNRLQLVNLRQLIRVAVLFMERGEYVFTLETPGIGIPSFERPLKRPQAAQIQDFGDQDG